MHASPTVHLTLSDGELCPQWLTDSGLRTVEPEELQVLLPRRVPLTVVVPPFWGALHRVPLPTRDYQKAIAAVPFAMEEQLNGEIAQRVFVLSKKPSGDGYWTVLVLDRDRVEEIRAILQSWGVAQARLCHSLSMWPRPDAGQWQVYRPADTTRLDVVDEHGSGFVLPMVDESLAQREIDRYAQAAGITEVVWASADSPSAQQQVDHVPRTAQDERLWQRPDERIAPVLSLTVDPENQQGQERKKQAVLSLILLGVVVLLYPVLQLIAEKRQAEQLAEQIAADFAVAMPDTRMVNPRVQVQPLLAQSELSAGLPAVMQLAQLSDQLEQAGLAGNVTALHYANERWRWRFSSVSAAALSDWRARAEQAGFEVISTPQATQEIIISYRGATW